MDPMTPTVSPRADLETFRTEVEAVWTGNLKELLDGRHGQVTR